MNNWQRWIIFSTLSCFATAAVAKPSAAPANPALSLQQYLDMVQAKDASWQSAQLAKEGAAKAQRNADIMTGVNFIANGSYLSDGRPTVNPAFQGTNTINKSYAFGLQQKSLLGVSWSLTQNYSYTNIENSTFLQVPEYYDAFPKLELSLPLWRDWLGHETRATQQQASAQLKMQSLRADLAMIQKENEIKDAFFNLATQQKNFEIQKDSLARAERILGWAKSRLARNLADRGDVYQIQALVSARKLELINADTKLKEAARLFNSYLNESSEEIKYALALDEIDTNVLNLDAAKEKVRMDLELEKENLNSMEANYQLQKEKNKPNLNLALSYLRQGRDIEPEDASSRVFKDKKESYMVAVQFAMPLDLSNLNDSKEGFEQLRQSQILGEKARQRSEAIQWKNTVDQAQALSNQLKIVRELEGIQKNKADLEREKYNNGRSTTYQVLTFEQDYANTRNQRINIERDLRRFINSLNLFR